MIFIYTTPVYLVSSPTLSKTKACAVKNWTTFEGVYFNKGMEQMKTWYVQSCKQCCHEKKVSYMYLQDSQNAIVGGISNLGH